MLLLNTNFCALIHPHVLHTLPEALRPRDVSDEEFNCTLTVLRTSVKDGLVVEVCDILDLAEPAKSGLALSFSYLLNNTGILNYISR